MAPNSWLHMQSAPGGHLNCIAPDLDRDNCSMLVDLLCLQYHPDVVSLLARSSGGSYDSDATVSEFLHRPCADPHVSPVQLLPLCDEVDSDDELFADENTATPDPAAGESVQQPVDEGYSDDNEQQSLPPATQGLDILFWTAGLKTDTTLMEYLTHPIALTDVNEAKLHQHISLRSHSISFPLHFAFADFTLQVLRPDPRALPLHLPTCRHEVPRIRAAAEAHIKTCHWPERAHRAPRARRRRARSGRGRWANTCSHAAECEVTWTPSVWCKLCDCESTDMCAFVEHFRACQVPFTLLQVRPHKRQRVDSGSGCSSDFRV
ncbi:hypothetical protein C8R44DRAFT_896313 [Mycena epipterygia]|nr:hypothetical protein C8R44DRAFT_896313 [Mycena epipterygia]